MSWNGSKKNLELSVKDKTSLLEKDHKQISISRQCQLLGIARSTAYYEPKGYSNEDLELMAEIDKIFTKCPFYGKRRISAELKRRGYEIGVKKTRGLMEIMGLHAVYPKPKTSLTDSNHEKYPYLLRGMKINKVNQVWGTDITYIKLSKGFIYLVAILDWFSRYVVSWNVSLTLEKEFCIEALKEALTKHQPYIFNSDQGVQFTSREFTDVLKEAEIKISMDGRGRCMDNIFTERLWRTVKYEEVYMKEYETPLDAIDGLKRYFEFYNYERIHQSLKYKTPSEVFFAQNCCA